MELSGMLVWAAVLVSLIALIIFLVKGFKGWGVWMTICFCILFIEGWCFLFFSASVNKLRLATQKSYDELTESVKKKEAEKTVLLFGAPIDPKPDLQKYIPLSYELSRVLVERGRAWRRATVSQATPQSATFELPPEVAGLPSPQLEGAPAVPAVPGQGKEGLGVNDVVYLFSESETFTPKAYVGEFKVTTVNNRLITVVPTTPLSQQQQVALRSSPTWAVYELLPLDSHRAFAKQGTPPSNDEIFGSMDPETISSLLAIPLELASKDPSTLNIVEANRAKILASYLQDGTRAREGTPLESIHYEVEFLKDYELRVDSNISNNAETGGNFNPEGQAVDPRIKRPSSGENSEVVAIKANDKNDKNVIRLYGPKAKQLEMDGIVKVGAGIFVRPLNDYSLGLQSTRRLTISAMDDAVLISREIAVTDKSQQIANGELKLAEDMQQRLEADQAQYKVESTVVNSEVDRLTKEIDIRLAETNKLYRDLVDLHSKLVAKKSAP